MSTIANLTISLLGKNTGAPATFSNAVFREQENFFDAVPVLREDFTKTGDGANAVYGPLNLPVGAVIKIIALSFDGKSVIKGQAVFLGYRDLWEVITNEHSLKGSYDINNLQKYTFHIVEVQKPIRLKKRMRMTNKGLVNNLTPKSFSFFRRTNNLIYVNGEFFMKRVFSVFNVFQNDITDATDTEIAIYMNSNTYETLLNKGKCIEGFAFIFGFPFYGNMGITPIKIDDSIADDKINVSPMLAYYILRDMDGDIVYVMGIPRIRIEVVKTVCSDLGIEAPTMKTVKIGGTVYVDLANYSLEELYDFFGLLNVKDWRAAYNDTSKDVATLIREWKADVEKAELIKKSQHVSEEDAQKDAAKIAYINNLRRKFL